METNNLPVRRFEDLIAWQRARRLTSEIYEITKRSDFSKDYGLCDQIRRAAVSNMSNIAEGFERNRHREFYQFLSIAKASCGELRVQLDVAFDVGYLDQNSFDALKSQAEEVSCIISGRKSSQKRLTK